MIITTEDQFHFFAHEETSRFHIIDIVSYLEYKTNNGEIRFKRLEEIRLFHSVNMDEYESGHFEISFGNRSGCGGVHGIKTANELINYHTEKNILQGKKVVTKAEYLAVRKRIFEIYLKDRMCDFNKLQIGAEILF